MEKKRNHVEMQIVVIYQVYTGKSEMAYTTGKI